MHSEKYFEGRNSFYIVWTNKCFQTESLENLKNYEEAVYCDGRWFMNPKRRNMKILEACEALCQKPQRRTGKIKFSVGQVVKFNISSVRAGVGVIIGWDDPLELRLKNWAETLSKYWYYDTPSYFFDDEKPFYTILCEYRHRTRVIEEEIIEILLPGDFTHVDIGRYFCRLEKNHYVPNQMLAKHYPYDPTVSSRK